VVVMIQVQRFLNYAEVDEDSDCPNNSADVAS
jgi:hypothetical protein